MSKRTHSNPGQTMLGAVLVLAGLAALVLPALVVVDLFDASVYARYSAARSLPAALFITLVGFAYVTLGVGNVLYGTGRVR